MKTTISLLVRSLLLVASLVSLDACKAKKANMAQKNKTDSKSDSIVIYHSPKSPNQALIDSIKQENLKEKKVKDSPLSPNN